MNVNFFNFSEEPVSGIVRVADFIVEGNEGKPVLVEDNADIIPKFSASSWITLPYDRVTIAAQDKVTIQYTLQVPADARPGGRYVSVYFEPTQNITTNQTNGQEQARAAIAPRIAQLIYIRIPGDATEGAAVTRFFSPSFMEYGPIQVESEILNRSDYHIRPKGMITMFDLAGNIVAQAKLAEYNIFPDVSRSYKNDLGKKWLFGRYKLTLAAAYGEKGQSLSRSMYVFVVPWRVITIIVLALFLILVVGKKIYDRFIRHEEILVAELEKEKEEIELLKEKIQQRHD